MGGQSSSNINGKIPCEKDIEVVIGLYFTCLFGGLALILLIIKELHSWNMQLDCFLTFTFDVLFLTSAILPIMMALYYRWYYKKWFKTQNLQFESNSLELVGEDRKKYIVERAASELFDRNCICFVTLRNLIWLGWIVFIPLFVITFANSWIDIFLTYFLGIIVVFVPGYFLGSFTIQKIVGWLIPYRFPQQLQSTISIVAQQQSVETSAQLSTDAQDTKEDFDEEFWERDVQDYLFNNPEVIEFGLKILYKEYMVGKWRIDLLGLDNENRHIIIELKKGRATEGAGHQVLNYEASYKARTGETVRKMVIAESFDDNFLALARSAGIEYKSFGGCPPIEKNARYCSRCGQPNHLNAKYCEKCGRPIGWMMESLTEIERKTPKQIPFRTPYNNYPPGEDDYAVRLRRELNNRYK